MLLAGVVPDGLNRETQTSVRQTTHGLLGGPTIHDRAVSHWIEESLES